MTWKRWLPHAITLLLAALLVLTQQVWAGPFGGRLTSPTVASSKTTINYQGYLTDSSGNPVNTTENNPLEMVFRLYNVESGGTYLWTETQSVVIKDGLFSVLLGKDTGGIPAGILADNDNLWLGIAVGSDVEELSPREKIASSPYAMLANVPDYSITSAQLANNAVTSTKIQDGEVGNADLGINSVTSAKIQDGQVSSSDVGFGYAASSTKAGPASDVACTNCISSGEIQDGQVTDSKLASPLVTRSVNLCFTPYSVCDGVVSNFSRVTLGSNQIWSGSFSFTPFAHGMVAVIGRIDLADDGTTFGGVPVAVWPESSSSARFSAIVPDRYFNTVNSRLIVTLVGH